MERRKALALAGTSSAILFTGLVAATAVGGVKLLGFGSHRAQAGTSSDTPTVVNQVKYVDDMVVVIPQTSAPKGPVKKSSSPKPAATTAATTAPTVTTSTTSSTSSTPTSGAPASTTSGPATSGPTTSVAPTSTTRPRTTTSSGPTTTDN